MDRMICSARLYELSYNILKLLSEEYGDDCWRSLVRTESVLITDIGSTLSEKIRMLINSL